MREFDISVEVSRPNVLSSKVKRLQNRNLIHFPSLPASKHCIHGSWDEKRKRGRGKSRSGVNVPGKNQWRERINYRFRYCVTNLPAKQKPHKYECEHVRVHYTVCRISIVKPGTENTQINCPSERGGSRPSSDVSCNSTYFLSTLKEG